MIRLSLPILLVCIIGCGKKPSTAPPKPTIDESATYQGRTARQWARNLKDRDSQRCYDAAFALNQLGKDGAPFLVEGICSNNDAARCFSLQLLQPDFAKPYFAELWPSLKILLDDDQEVDRLGAFVRPIDVRLGAIALLGGMGSEAKESLPVLKKTRFLYSRHATISRQEDEQRFNVVMEGAIKSISR